MQVSRTLLSSDLGAGGQLGTGRWQICALKMKTDSSREENRSKFVSSDIIGLKGSWRYLVG